MTNPRAEIVTELAALARELAGPMPAGAASDGWRPETWCRWAATFAELERKALGSEALSHASIARALDHDGVLGGPILERAAVVSNSIRALGEDGEKMGAHH